VARSSYRFPGMVLASLPWLSDRPTLDELLIRPRWQRSGLCASTTGVSWFPAKGEPVEPAKAICRRCPVIDECLDFALTVGGSLEGIWAAHRNGSDDTLAGSSPRGSKVFTCMGAFTLTTSGNRSHRVPQRTLL
jgi:hypothetical protein